MTRIYKIHPAIGVARVGNADRAKAFIGPEAPGIPANFDTERNAFFSFKDDGLVKPQAARFRVWEYEQLDDGSLNSIGEANLSTPGIEKIEWHVHVANRKASFFRFDGQRGAEDDFATNGLRNESIADADRRVLLDLDPGKHSISGRNAPAELLTNTNALTQSEIPDLGELRTDLEGRLVFVGGSGRAFQTEGAPDLHEYVNNDGWFDDVSDGFIAATVTRSADGKTESTEADSAWVIVGPPDFAPAIGNVVSLYDTMCDLAVRGLVDLPPVANDDILEVLRQQRQDWSQTNRSFSDYQPSFANDIAPLLDRAFKAIFVHSPLPSSAFHSSLDDAMYEKLQSNENVRRDVFARLRDPDGVNASAKLMPKGLGDRYVDEDEVPSDDPRALDPRRFFSLTRYQYELLRQWSLGRFIPSKKREPVVVGSITPHGLDRAALENCVGGPFFPGIEVSWLVRRPEVYREAFRIGLGKTVGQLVVGPGFLTQQMALPWQADFRDCRREALTDPTTGDETSAMWWAAQRPDDVYLEEDPTEQAHWTREPFFTVDDDDFSDVGKRYGEMRANWFKQGFVAKLVGRIWTETERG